MLEIAIYVLTFWAGIIVGVLFKGWLNSRFSDYSGQMVITEDEDRKLYSLELFEEVEDLDNRTEIRFKVVSPDRE